MQCPNDEEQPLEVKLVLWEIQAITSQITASLERPLTIVQATHIWPTPHWWITCLLMLQVLYINHLLLAHHHLSRFGHQTILCHNQIGLSIVCLHSQSGLHSLLTINLCTPFTHGVAHHTLNQKIQWLALHQLPQLCQSHQCHKLHQCLNYWIPLWSFH